MNDLSVEKIAAKMDALGLWDALLPYNWAVKPSGTALPYFCTVFKGDSNPVKVRFMMLEGWQTLHDFIRTRIDGNFGCYSSPMELPHLELVISADGGAALFRHDPVFVPVKADPGQRALAAKILWEAYGVMLRIESDRSLPMKFSGEKAVFARVEDPRGSWSDAPLAIPDPPASTERVVLPKDDVKLAQDLPFDRDGVLEIDFRLMPRLMTKEARPRTVYQLCAFDPLSGSQAFTWRSSAVADGGLKGLWEELPSKVLKALISRGRVPGSVKTVSGRVFRFLRPLTLELPFRLSLHDSLSGLESLFSVERP